MKVYLTKEFLMLKDSVKSLYFYLLVSSVDNFVSKPQTLFEVIKPTKEDLVSLLESKYMFIVKDGIYIVTNTIDWKLLQGTQIVKKEETLKKQEGFKKPTLEEIEKYCIERNNNVDAEKFYNFYESKGWMVGKTKMKNWKAAVITWESNRRTPSQDTNNLGDLL